MPESIEACFLIYKMEITTDCPGSFHKFGIKQLTELKCLAHKKNLWNMLFKTQNSPTFAYISFVSAWYNNHVKNTVCAIGRYKNIKSNPELVDFQLGWMLV
jgi:hypothetical protein